MSKSDKYLPILDDRGLFENSEHRTRFKELVDCYGEYPFFTKGLCKCMYLSAWDQEHFAVILQVLSDLAIGKERDTEEMRIQGDALAERQKGGEYYVYQLSNAFLDGEAFAAEDGAEIPDDYMYIIRRALEAEKAIDEAED